MHCLVHSPGSTAKAWRGVDVASIDTALTEDELEAKGFGKLEAAKAAWSRSAAAAQLLSKAGGERDGQFIRRTCARRGKVGLLPSAALPARPF